MFNDICNPFSKKREYTGLALSVLLSALPAVLPSNIFHHTFLSNHASQPLQTLYDASARGLTYH